MKKADIKRLMDAGEPVAIYDTVYHTRNYPTTAREATVVAIGVKRADGSGYRWAMKEDGIRVRPDRNTDRYGNDSSRRPPIRLDNYGRKVIRETDTEDIVITSRDIIDSWADFERKSAKVIVAKQAERDRRQAEQDRRSRIIKGFAAYGFNVTGRYDSRIATDVETAEAILKRLEQK